MMYTKKLDCFPLSRVYFVSCLTGSAACLCAFAGVVRVSQIELASNFYTSCHKKTERSFPLSVGYSLIAVTSIQGSSRLQSFTSLLRTIPLTFFANVLQGVRFKLFNAFVSAIIGSPTLPHVQPVVCALLGVSILITFLQTLNFKKRPNFLQTCPLFFSLLCEVFDFEVFSRPF